MTSVRIRSFTGPYFLAFGLDTERYGVSLRIQSKCRKIQTKETPNMNTFHAVREIHTGKYFSGNIIIKPSNRFSRVLNDFKQKPVCLIANTNQMPGFRMKCNTLLKQFNLDEMTFSEFLEISRTIDYTGVLNKTFSCCCKSKVLTMELKRICYIVILFCYIILLFSSYIISRCFNNFRHCKRSLNAKKYFTQKNIVGKCKKTSKVGFSMEWFMADFCQISGLTANITFQVSCWKITFSSKHFGDFLEISLFSKIMSLRSLRNARGNL